MTTDHDPVPLKSNSQFSLWYGLLAGGMAWLVHLILAWVIAEFGCVSRFHELRFAGLTAVAWSGLAMSVALLVVAASALWIARNNELRLHHSVTEPTLDRDSRLFMARSGVMASATFIIIIAVQTIPFLFYLGGC